MNIMSSLAATVVAVMVKEGDVVRLRHILGRIEAMKMEQNILSPLSGTVKRVAVTEGEEVDAEQLLFIVE